MLIKNVYACVACVHLCMYVQYACIYVYMMYICVYVCVYVCMYVCTYVYVYVCVCAAKLTSMSRGAWGSASMLQPCKQGLPTYVYECDLNTITAVVRPLQTGTRFSKDIWTVLCLTRAGSRPGSWEGD